jgi:hypothetical protein
MRKELNQMIKMMLEIEGKKKSINAGNAREALNALAKCLAKDLDESIARDQEEDALLITFIKYVHSKRKHK